MEIGGRENGGMRRKGKKEGSEVGGRALWEVGEAGWRGVEMGTGRENSRKKSRGKVNWRNEKIRGRRRVEEKGRNKEKKEFKIVFWNVAGLGNKDKNFIERIKEWDLVIMSETWVENKGWESIRKRLPRGFE